MGGLNFFDLSKYRSDVLIETGTGVAHGLSYAMRFGFEVYFSCEINEQLYNSNAAAFQGVPHVKLFNCDSLTFLNNILPVVPKEKRILFWLDAHFPGADFITHKHTGEDNEINLPLVHEIGIIYKYRQGCKDTILIDDLRLLEPYEREKLEQLGLFLNYPGLEFLDCFKETHDIHKHYVHEGYLEIIPKEL